MATNWSKDCDGRKFLIKEFQKYIDSGGTEGIDYKTAATFRPKQVKDLIFDKYQQPKQLQGYKRERFPENFRDTIRAFEIDQTKNEARKQGNAVALFFKFVFILFEA